MKVLLEAINLKKIYKVGKVEVEALRGVNLQVREGEFVSVMGPSGCGKSTLLHILGAMDRPTSGHVVIDGKNTSRMSDADLTEIRRKKIRFVFQRFNLLPTLTARGNIEVARRIQGNHSSNGADERLCDLLRLLMIEGKMGHKPSELSGGEQQRVAIARAVVNHPAILLADEPTGNLDTKNSQIVLKMFEELNRQFNQTIVLITHNPEVAAVTHRLIGMRDGQVVNYEEDPAIWGSTNRDLGGPVS